MSKLKIVKLETQQIADAFNALSEKHDLALRIFHPVLEKMNSIVAKFHDAGVDHMGFEVATFDALRDLNLIGSKSDDYLNVILTASDARFILRLDQRGQIDCCLQNMNKEREELIDISDEFWISDNGDFYIDKYNILDDEDCLTFVHQLLDLSAECLAHQNLKSFDLPAKQTSHMPKRRTRFKW